MESGPGMHPKDRTLPFTPVLAAAQLENRGHKTSMIDVPAGGGVPARIVEKVAAHDGPVLIEVQAGKLEHFAEFTQQLKYRNNKTVAAYGFIPTRNPARLLEMNVADYCIAGEGEGIIPAFVDWLRARNEPPPPGVMFMRNGRLTGCPDDSPPGTDDMPFIPAEVLKSNRYHKDSFPLQFAGLRWGFVLANRGCLYRCPFCTGIARQSLLRKYRPCSPARLVDEMHYQVSEAGRNIISIEDDLFTGRREWVIEVLELLEKLPRRIRWIAQTRFDCLDEELIIKMKNAGCAGLSLGMESGSDRILDILGKNTDTQTIRRIGALLLKHGVATRYTVMLGAPGEKARDFALTATLVRRLKPLVVQIYFCTPYTDTVLDPHVADGSLRMAEPQPDISNLSGREMESLRLAFYRSYYLSFNYLRTHFVRLLAYFLLNSRQAVRITTLFISFFLSGRRAGGQTGETHPA